MAAAGGGGIKINRDTARTEARGTIREATSYNAGGVNFRAMGVSRQEGERACHN